MPRVLWGEHKVTLIPKGTHRAEGSQDSLRILTTKYETIIIYDSEVDCFVP
ncbi:hypothetical protein J2755_000083 [Methanohalophilus levihalophilus]|nr:hypothetical protein [Methanohalophilus levihalophilus]